MVTTTSIARVLREISERMTENRDHLVKLDQVNGDGDLGISMDDGFRALTEYYEGADTPSDLGAAFREGAKVMNSSAPSSLGTILSFGLMGMAKALRGRTNAEPVEVAQALVAGVENIMAKAESAPGEKTILDSLHPGAQALASGLGDEGLTVGEATGKAAQAAADGSEATRQMEAVHGRAAYSAARSIGVLDGGSVVGRLIFEGIEAGVSEEQ